MNNKSRTSLVLMELIITILFFSVASAVCVQLFVQSHLTTKQTKLLNEATNKAQSIAEVINGTDGSLNAVKSYFPSAEGENDYFVICYDEEFNETYDSDKASYAVDVTTNSVGKLYNTTITFVDLTTPDYDIIYTLDTSKYIRNNGK